MGDHLLYTLLQRCIPKTMTRGLPAEMTMYTLATLSACLIVQYVYIAVFRALRNQTPYLTHLSRFNGDLVIF